VQGGMSAYGGIWGAYLPIIDVLRNRLDILQVQLYNSGSMYGIDGGIYTQGTADFIVSQTEALLQGFTTDGGYFAPLPPEKVAIGRPACPLAAGGGYVTPAVLEQAVAYLRGTGPQPGAVRHDKIQRYRGGELEQVIELAVGLYLGVERDTVQGRQEDGQRDDAKGNGVQHGRATALGITAVPNIMVAGK
ncbi:MAG: hypothetical protein ACK46C_02800, partial [Flavobacteriales bacterium]